jgi:hypothetical protein
MDKILTAFNDNSYVITFSLLLGVLSAAFGVWSHFRSNCRKELTCFVTFTDENTAYITFINTGTCDLSKDDFPHQTNIFLHSVDTDVPLSKEEVQDIKMVKIKKITSNDCQIASKKTSGALKINFLGKKQIIRLQIRTSKRVIPYIDTAIKDGDFKINYQLNKKYYFEEYWFCWFNRFYVPICCLIFSYNHIRSNQKAWEYTWVVFLLLAVISYFFFKKKMDDFGGKTILKKIERSEKRAKKIVKSPPHHQS